MKAADLLYLLRTESNAARKPQLLYLAFEAPPVAQSALAPELGLSLLQPRRLEHWLQAKTIVALDLAKRLR